MKIPWTLLGYIAAGLLIIAGANHALGFIPLTPQWTAKRSAVQVAALQGQVSSLQAVVRGNAAIAAATDTFHTREIVIREVAAKATAENEQADDASTPLSVERRSRLRSHDRVLCERSGLCSPAPDDAGGGAEGLRGVDLAG